MLRIAGSDRLPATGGQVKKKTGIVLHDNEALDYHVSSPAAWAIKVGVPPGTGTLKKAGWPDGGI
ncbi:MAG: hypothetical protein JOZ80_11545, partial [Acidobacteriaceae bacterium]|nr:hypothetical protein [Acidobacteriaceae bacterium]